MVISKPSQPYPSPSHDPTGGGGNVEVAEDMEMETPLARLANMKMI